jgi:hypothetical protein
LDGSTTSKADELPCFFWVFSLARVVLLFFRNNDSKKQMREVDTSLSIVILRSAKAGKGKSALRCLSLI